MTNDDDDDDDLSSTSIYGILISEGWNSRTALPVTGHGYELDNREIADPFSAGATYLHFLLSVQTSLMFSG